MFNLLQDSRCQTVVSVRLVETVLLQRCYPSVNMATSEIESLFRLFNERFNERMDQLLETINTMSFSTLERPSGNLAIEARHHGKFELEMGDEMDCHEIGLESDTIESDEYDDSDCEEYDPYDLDDRYHVYGEKSQTVGEFISSCWSERYEIGRADSDTVYSSNEDALQTQCELSDSCEMSIPPPSDRSQSQVQIRSIHRDTIENNIQGSLRSIQEMPRPTEKSIGTNDEAIKGHDIWHLQSGTCLKTMNGDIRCGSPVKNTVVPRPSNDCSNHSPSKSQVLKRSMNIVTTLNNPSGSLRLIQVSPKRPTAISIETNNENNGRISSGCNLWRMKSKLCMMGTNGYDGCATSKNDNNILKLLDDRMAVHGYSPHISVPSSPSVWEVITRRRIRIEKRTQMQHLISKTKFNGKRSTPDNRSVPVQMIDCMARHGFSPHSSSSTSTAATSADHSRLCQATGPHTVLANSGRTLDQQKPWILHYSIYDEQRRIWKNLAACYPPKDNSISNIRRNVTINVCSLPLFTIVSCRSLRLPTKALCHCQFLSSAPIAKK